MLKHKNEIETKKHDTMKKIMLMQNDYILYLKIVVKMFDT